MWFRCGIHKPPAFYVFLLTSTILEFLFYLYLQSRLVTDKRVPNKCNSKLEDMHRDHRFHFVAFKPAFIFVLLCFMTATKIVIIMDRLQYKIWRQYLFSFSHKSSTINLFGNQTKNKQNVFQTGNIYERSIHTGYYMTFIPSKNLI